MSKRLFVATRKGLFRVDRGETGWRITNTSFLGDNLSLVSIDPRDGRVYAAPDLGHFGVKLWGSGDGGESWEELAAPAYPPKPEGLVDKLADGREWPWRVEKIWALEAGPAGAPGLLYCGTIPGALFRSTDAGNTWELVRSLWDHPDRKKWFGGGADYPGIHSIVVDRSGALTLGVSCGGVWYSPDAGVSWEIRAKGMYAEYMPPEQREEPTIQDPHRVVACPSRPECLWSQHHNGVFRSTDGGLSWRDVKAVVPSKFGFAIAVHPKDPETAWTVPAQKDEKRIPVEGKVVVARTRDGGESFTALRKGLPQEHAYDITFRHALDVDETGDVLAFGTTTGSLWISEDAGDSWVTISNHLPPVHSVRFDVR